MTEIRTFTAFYLHIKIGWLRFCTGQCQSTPWFPRTKHQEKCWSRPPHTSRHSASSACAYSYWHRVSYSSVHIDVFISIFECRKCQAVVRHVNMRHYSLVLSIFTIECYPFILLPYQRHIQLCIEVPDFIELIGRIDVAHRCSLCKVIRFVRKYRRTNVVLCHIKLLCLFDSFDSARLFHFRRCCRRVRRQRFHLHSTYLFVCYSGFLRLYESATDHRQGLCIATNLEKIRSKEKGRKEMRLSVVKRKGVMHLNRLEMTRVSI